MLTIPYTGRRGSLRRVMLAVLRRRRTAIAISGTSSVVAISALLCAALWSWSRRSGEPAGQTSAILWSCSLGVAHALLSCAVARTTPFWSKAGRSAHFAGGFVVGTWTAPLLCCVVGAIPAVVFAALGLTVDGVPGAVFSLRLCLILGSVFCVVTPVYCLRAGLVASKGQSVLAYMRSEIQKGFDVIRAVDLRRRELPRLELGRKR
jgi:hypothetical protein